MKKITILAGSLTVLLLVAACGQNSEQEKASPKVIESQTENTEKGNELPQVLPSESDFLDVIKEDKIEHMHGVGYAGNQNAIFFATHEGLRIYYDKTWYKTKKENNDYMGFSATQNGFYSSGHPGSDSTLINPIGLVKTSDYGKTFTKLGFEGKSDFHYMAAGYSHNAIYVVNEQQHSNLGTGMYVTTDEGESWKRSKLGGTIPNQVMGMATHPKKEEWLALSSPEGVFLSTDYGNTFKLYTEKNSVTAIHFTDKELFYASNDNGNKLFVKNLESEDVTEIKLPRLNNEDMIMFLAENPQNEQEIVIATMNNHVWITKDRGEAWDSIMKDGIIQ